jgi:hypothetical protein
MTAISSSAAKSDIAEMGLTRGPVLSNDVPYCTLTPQHVTNEAALACRA